MTKPGFQVRLRPLPKAFLNASARVDVDLLQELFSAILKPSKQVRDLLHRRAMRGIKKGVSPFDQLAMEIVEPEFRARWYFDKERGYDHSVSPLFTLIEIRNDRKYPELNREDGAIGVGFDR